MRDPTRGGLATTLVEIAEDFHVTMKINELDLPVKEEVHGVCDLLGFDPSYLANEGKAIIIVANKKRKVLRYFTEFPEGKDAVVIGSIIGKEKGQLLLETPLGSKRLLTRLSERCFREYVKKNALILKEWGLSFRFYSVLSSKSEILCNFDTPESLLFSSHPQSPAESKFSIPHPVRFPRDFFV